MQQQTAESLSIINNFGRDYFADQLFNTDEGEDIALSYLKQRGFREDIIRKFELGYCPQSGHSFADAALTNKYNPELLKLSGLVVNRYEKLQDNYRERIIFPIHNRSGKVLGFGARLIKKNDKAPKYINTPENEIYSKSKILYGTFFAKHAIDKEDECILVEGYTDVVSLHQAGIENVVASGGTSLTVDQLRLIKKFTKNLTIIYDGDSAGVKAALRGLNIAIEEGLHVKLLLIPENEDPDSYVNKIGTEAFKLFVKNNKKDFVLFQLDVFMKDAGNDSTKKMQMVNEIADTISRLNRPEEFTRRNDYINAVSQKLKIDEAGFTDLVNKFIRDGILKDQEINLPKAKSLQADEATEDETLPADFELLQKDEGKYERALIKALLEFGLEEWTEDEKVADFLIKEIDDNEIDAVMSEPILASIYHIYKKMYLAGEQPVMKHFLYHEDPSISNQTVLVMGLPLEISQNWSKKYQSVILTRADLYKEEVHSVLAYLKLQKLKNLITENQMLLEAATSSEDQILYMQTHQVLKTMEKEITKEMGTVILK
jgi:DNA primase